MEENHMGWKLVSGVRQDVVNLFKLFASTNSVRYEEFCKVWKEMKFSTIFRHVYIERLEFVEEIFQIVKNYLSSAYEFQTRIAALFTLYGLYFKQPLREPVKIRFQKLEWEEVQSLIAHCKAEKHCDVVFIYLKMFLNNAFVFTASLRAAGLEIGFRKYLKQRYTLLPNHCDVELLYRPLLNEKLVSSLVLLERLYCKKKLELLGKRNIEFIDTKFSASLHSELKKYASKSQRLTTNIKSGKEVESNETDEESLESDCKKDKVKSSNQSSNKEQGKNSQIEKTVKKRKLSGKYLLAKKKAELYIKQLHEKQQQTSEADSQKSEFQLPDLDLL